MLSNPDNTLLPRPGRCRTSYLVRNELRQPNTRPCDLLPDHRFGSLLVNGGQRRDHLLAISGRNSLFTIAAIETRGYRKLQIVLPRLGRGLFRILFMAAFSRRSAITDGVDAGGSVRLNRESIGVNLPTSVAMAIVLVFLAGRPIAAPRARRATPRLW
jgi:hypothetical protein